MADWISFWDSDHPIYVNARHRDVHYRRIAEDIRRYVPSSDAVVLDYGCGEALHARLVAAAAGRLVLCEAAPQVRAALAGRFEDAPDIAVTSPDELSAMPDGSFDLIVMHSVAQYLTSDQLAALLVLFRRLLKPGGALLLGDVIPPDVSAITDAGSLIGFAAASGFLGAALVGLVRTGLSDYWRLRQQLGLARYRIEDITGMLAAAGLSARLMPKNIGHNPARMTFMARPDPGAVDAAPPGADAVGQSADPVGQNADRVRSNAD
jgi:SAM-dependent methyltransferase